MKSLQINSLYLSFADRKILDGISFQMDEKSRYALVGANGSGKSTLFKSVMGIIEPDDINISITKGGRISYLPQSDVVLKNESVYESAEHGYDHGEAGKCVFRWHGLIVGGNGGENGEVVVE